MPPEPGDEEEKRGCVLSWPSSQKEIVWLSFLRDSPRVVQTGGRRRGRKRGGEREEERQGSGERWYRKEARDLFIQDDTDMQVPQMSSGAEMGEQGRARPAGARQRGKAGARRSARSGLTSTGTRRGRPGGGGGVVDVFRHPARWWRQVGAVLSAESMVRLEEGAGFGSWGCEAAWTLCLSEAGRHGAGHGESAVWCWRGLAG